MRNVVSKILMIPTIGLLKTKRPAFIFNKIINADEINTLIIILIPSDQPTRKIHQI